MNQRPILTVTQLWDGRIILKLEERPFQDILWINLFNSQQVQYHVIGQVEG